MRVGWLLMPLLMAVAGCRAEPVPTTEQGSTGDVPTSERSPATATPRALWRPLGEWSGSGERQTGSFDVTTGSLRVAWEAVGAGSDAAGWLRISLHSAISGRHLQTIVDVDAPGADTVLVAASPRVAYLLVEADGLAWRIALEEGMQGRPE